MSKRTAWLLAVLFLIVGGAAGYALRAPGSPRTWADIRTWAGSAVVVIGVVIALVQLEMQRRQLADQRGVIEGEFKRNERRDELLDGQLRELRDREVARVREQAEQVDLELASTAEAAPIYMGNVLNRSGRPIRGVACRIKPAADEPTQEPHSVGLLADWKLGGEVARRIMVDPAAPGKDRSALLVRAGLTVSFAFGIGRQEFPDAKAVARFTDDAGLHWQLDQDLHLHRLPQRDW